MIFKAIFLDLELFYVKTRALSQQDEGINLETLWSKISYLQFSQNETVLLLSPMVCCLHNIESTQLIIQLNWFWLQSFRKGSSAYALGTVSIRKFWKKLSEILSCEQKSSAKKVNFRQF